MNTKETKSATATWYKYDGLYSKLEYFATREADSPSFVSSRTVASVGFDCWNEDAQMTQMVWITWQNVFQWADADKCGGLGLKAVRMSDGSEVFASGLYFGSRNEDGTEDTVGGLCQVVVGCYGSAWMRRNRASRDATKKYLKESRIRSERITETVHAELGVNGIGSL